MRFYFVNPFRTTQRDLYLVIILIFCAEICLLAELVLGYIGQQ